jgi:hypothetical protein
MEKIEKSTKRLEIVNQWISNCDTKSSFILTFYGIVLTIIFTSNCGAEMISTFSFSKSIDIEFENFKNFILLILAISFYITSIITFYQIYSTLKGRIDAKVYQQNGLNSNSNIFFGSIASKTFDTYQNESNNEDEQTYLNDLNSQVFINSNIVSEKFKHYNKSLFYMFISLALFLLYNVLK